MKTLTPALSQGEREGRKPNPPPGPLPLGGGENRRAFATLAVLWVVGLAVVLIAAAEAAAYRQAAAGREAIARVRAKWAARAGIEAALAKIESLTVNPDLTTAYAITDAVAAAADGTLAAGTAAYRVSYTSPTGAEQFGAQDAHARINVNTMTADDLMLLPRMTEDVADAILDWIDGDDDPQPLGAESAIYQSGAFPYEPRNAPVRSLAELELVLGVTPEMVRGEDWNLNGRLDPNEDDGDASWPTDNADGKLDAGWSGIITASSTDGGVAVSGQARIDLTDTAATELAPRIKVTTEQADAIIQYAANANATMGDFIRRNLTNLSGNNSIENLTREQQASLLAEAGIGPSASGVPGKLNVNSCPAEAFEYLQGLDPALADAIIAERESRPAGFSSIVDLLDVPGMTRNRLSRISTLLDVRSNVYILSSRGRDARTGIETEMTATIDRSTIPATVRELRVP